MSDYDLETADAMLRTKRFLYVAFMCHQSIEKALKACCVFIKSDTPPYTHNLSRLCEWCGIDKQLSEEHLNLISELEPFKIEARYPTYKEALLKLISFERREKILDETKKL
ncbi:MAG: HEPN domain-containing protein [Chitinophagales bacterium]|nr:HEPN domain-containing protein [Chitinophagales bacterium]